MCKSLEELWQACGVVPVRCDAGLEAGNILVYALHLDRGFPDMALPFLSDDEKARASRYGRRRDGMRFIISRAMLRGVLGLHAGIDPSRLALRYGPHGRPMLAPGQAEGLDFSLARSEDWCVIAIGRGRRIGVDLESLGSAAMIESMQALLSEEDRAAIATSSPNDHDSRLVAAWTAMEARAKAIGSGIDKAFCDASLECKHFQIGSKMIGCVAADGCNWQMDLVIQNDL